MIASVVQDMDTNSDERPATKRVRSGLSPGRGTVGDTKKTSLQDFPLDIFFEIFSLLSPLDLASLAQTNQAFRATLSSPIASDVWRRARKAAWGAPECPPKVSEVAWARLLFGPPKCQECGIHNVHKIEFALRRRVCTKCKKKKLIYSNFIVQYIGCDVAMLELIPYTNFGPSAQGKANPKSKFYWEDDVRSMVSKYEELRMDTHSKKPGAEEVFQQFWDERVKYVQAVAEHAQKCIKWWKEVGSDQHGLSRSRAQRRYDELVRRFRAMGYEDKDICVISDHIESRRHSSVTDRIWNNIRPLLQELIEIARCARLDREKKPLVNARRNMVRQAYDGYKRTIRPIEWIHLPPFDIICAMSVFRSLIYDNIDSVPSQQAACDAAVTEFPGCIALFKDKLKTCLLGLVNDMDAYDIWAQKVKRRSFNQKHHLSLAASVFMFRQHSVACSVEEALALLTYYGDFNTPAQQAACVQFWKHLFEGSHQRSAGWSSNSDWMFQYIPTGKMAVSGLITELGLDPEMAKPEDLDKLDWRFTCRQCEQAEAPQVPRDLVYSWRLALVHFLRYPHKWAFNPLRALSKDECDAVRRTEGVDPSLAQLMWSCNHCAIHLNNWQTYAVALDHVREMHAIREPQQNVDLFHAFPTGRKPFAPLRLSKCVTHVS